MKRILLLTLLIGVAACNLFAQVELDNIQIHGFATQSALFSNVNNFAGMDTSSVNTSWTEAAINFNDQISNKLRVGVQFHLTRLGTFGDSTPEVDWALGDYSVNRYLGIRGGKVKIRWGLYNDTQDFDPGYVWSLLPEPIYAIDWRSTNLSQYGVEFYGKLPMAKKYGEVRYSLYYGDYVMSTADGYYEGYKESGYSFTSTPIGKTPGVDIRYKTPLPGLMVGGSLMAYDGHANLTDGTFRNPLTYWPTGYVSYEHGKLSLAYQCDKLVAYTVATTSAGRSSNLSDQRAWFVMASYHITDKLQAGSYYTRLKNASLVESTAPGHFYDGVISGRYDFNSNFYGKLEQHFIDGTGTGFYGINNPNGLKPNTKLTVAKLGFVF